MTMNGNDYGFIITKSTAGVCGCQLSSYILFNALVATDLIKNEIITTTTVGRIHTKCTKHS